MITLLIPVIPAVQTPTHTQNTCDITLFAFIIAVLFIVLVAYYATVFAAFTTNDYGDEKDFETKKDFLRCLIPFYFWMQGIKEKWGKLK